LIADKPVVIDFVNVPKTDKVTVNINDVFTVQGDAVFSLVLLSNSFREKPVQDGEIDVHRFELVAIEAQVLLVQAVFKVVKLDESPIIQRNAEMLSGKVPDTWHS
jgi:hypothetical protein